MIKYDSQITPEYLFPSEDKDPFLKDLLEFQKRQNLTRIKPFQIAWEHDIEGVHKNAWEKEQDEAKKAA